ncbi:MAG: hypothetical protein E6K65_12345 [Nitrospirae bacterium]|nr:MAG: hypothetical protein E6K65_12345 [Nitrospirota bacterium]
MDFDLKLKALTRLAQSTTEAAETALQKELYKVTVALEIDTQYDLLEQHLEVLDTIGYRFSSIAIGVLLKFTQTIESRQITYSSQDRSIESEIVKYQNASTLIVRSVEAMNGLRYLETKSVLHALLDLSQHRLDNVRAKAFDALESLARYDINVFYGNDKHAGIGAAPQKLIIDDLELFQDHLLRMHCSAILVLVDALLSPTIHGASWSYKSVTLSQGPTPSLPTVEDIRRRSIQLLKRIYEMVATVSLKLEVIRVLNEATRTYGLGQINEHTAKMIVRDSVDVLTFYATLIQGEDLQIIQKIEDSSYWIFYHAIRPEIKTTALRVEEAIRQHFEYQVYKNLIGFEGKFGDWTEQKNNDGSGEEVDKFRKEKASEYATNITPDNYTEWHQRILKYVQTESNDLATFPIFYHFLEVFAAAQPQLALQLISTDSERIKGFLVPLLRSLWEGPQGNATRSLVTSWVEQGRYLWQCTRQFLASEHVDRDMLTLLFRKAKQLEDLDTVAGVISVAASNYSNDKPWLIDDLFLPALEVLTEHLKTNWLFDFWFRRESRVVVRELSEPGIELVLRNLLALKTIDYRAEEVLYLIAQRSPHKVFRFLCQRLVAHSQDGEQLSSTYDAIPFRLHKLNEPLSKIPGEAVRLLREQYDGNYSMFIHRGARLLKIIFPSFSDEFEAELLKIVRAGGSKECEFVLAILRNYEGEPFIHNACKEIIRLLPSDSPFRTEVAIAMESTGVVTGEFGLAEAYERKKNEVTDWMTDPNEKVQEFAKWYMANVEAMSGAERKRAEEQIALRKHRYGEQ